MTGVQTCALPICFKSNKGARVEIKKAIITAAGKSQRTLPLQTLVDRDGNQKTALQIIIEEVLQMTKAGKAPNAEMQAIINKVLTGQKINEEEAKSLYSWLLGAKESVVPTPYRVTSISQTIKQLQDQYEQYLQSGGRWISTL